MIIPIILAGGSGTRLHPITIGVSKQMLPVYDKPMIYYPLSTLMLAGITEILIISTSKDINRYKELFNNGNHFGLSISYEVQRQPNGLAEAFIIGESFIGSDTVALILGDNLFYGEGLSELLLNSKKRVEEDNLASIFAYSVVDPENYGVVNFDDKMKPTQIIEKPDHPSSNFAVVGLYFFPNNVVEIAKKVKPSDRGELEITTVNQEYLKRGELKVELMGRGFAWLDTGTHESLIEASNYIKMVETRQGLKVACLEVIACKMGYISSNQLLKLADPLKKNGYGQYLIERAKDL